MTVPEGTPSSDHAELAERLRRHVDRLAGLIGPRHVDCPSALGATASLIEREFSESGCAVQRQSYRVHEVEVANLVVEVPGTVPGAGILILGAHYDTVETSPGADDNASAIAVMLELARLLRDRQFRRTVRFVAFACEEPPHFYTDDMGSQIYARECLRRGERVTGMLCLEMVGYFTDQPGTQQIPQGFRDGFDGLSRVEAIFSRRSETSDHGGWPGPSGVVSRRRRAFHSTLSCYPNP